MKATKRALAGRTITDVDFRPFPAGTSRGTGTSHDPILTLDNGRKIYFSVEETEVGKYGVSIRITDPIREGANHGETD